MKWSFEKIGNLCRIKHGFAFKGEFFTDSGEFILLTPGNFNETGGLKLKGEKEKYYRGEIPADFILEEGDLLIVLTDLMQNAPILGGAAFIPESNRFLHNQRLGKVEHLNLSRIDARFFFYCLNDQSYRGQVRSSATGSTVRHSAPERIYNCQIPLPTLPTQQKIAAILSAYDDLIENNLRRIRLLEEAAKHLYREWFVRFRFPGCEEVKVMNGLPEGWERKKLSDVYVTSSGGTPSRTNPEFFNGEVNWFKSKELMDCPLIESEEKISETAVRNSSAKLFPENTVLLAMYGATIGKLGILTIPATSNQACCGIISKDRDFNHLYLYQWLLANKEHILSFRMGAAQENISQSVIRDLEMLIPSRKEVQKFNAFSELAFQQIVNLTKQNQKLKEARDLLLPQLMNQTIQV